MLTFEEAKLQFNSDANWWPTRNSQEYKEILQLVKNSGSLTRQELLGIAPSEITHRSCLVNGAYHNPLNKHIADVKIPAISKHNFMGISSNKRAVLNHIIDNTPIPQIVSAPAEPQVATLPPGKIPTGISKAEFFKLEGVKKYVDVHISNNKKNSC